MTGRNWGVGAGMGLGVLCLIVGAAAETKRPSPTGEVVYQVRSERTSGTQTLSWIEEGKRLRYEFEADAPARPGEPARKLRLLAFLEGTTVVATLDIRPGEYHRWERSRFVRGQGVMGLTLMELPADRGRRIGAGRVLGRPCDIYEKDGARVWIWQGMVLRMQLTTPQWGAVAVEATRLTIPFPQDPSRFRPPAGTPVRDFPLVSVRKSVSISPGRDG